MLLHISAVAQKWKGQIPPKKPEILAEHYLSFCRNGDLSALIGKQHPLKPGEKSSSSLPGILLHSFSLQKLLFPQVLLYTTALATWMDSEKSPGKKKSLHSSVLSLLKKQHQKIETCLAEENSKARKSQEEKRSGKLKKKNPHNLLITFVKGWYKAACIIRVWKWFNVFVTCQD